MVRLGTFRCWGVYVLVGLGSLVSTPLVGGETLLGPDNFSSLSGYVYADINNNGLRDSFEVGISGVEIVLKGIIDQTGDPVLMTTDTDDNGDYLFANLSAGEYSVTEIQPEEFIDGATNAVGSLGGLAPDDDQFTDIGLPLGVAAKGYNFGERGLKAGYLSKTDLLVPEPSTFATLATALVALVAFGRFCRKRG